MIISSYLLPAWSSDYKHLQLTDQPFVPTILQIIILHCKHIVYQLASKDLYIYIYIVIENNWVN